MCLKYESRLWLYGLCESHARSGGLGCNVCPGETLSIGTIEVQWAKLVVSIRPCICNIYTEFPDTLHISSTVPTHCTSTVMGSTVSAVLVLLVVAVVQSAVIWYQWR